MTINENEVLTEFDKRLQTSIDDCSGAIISSQCISATSTTVHNQNTDSHLDVSNSSQNSDSYYESLLEDTLSEKQLERCDSFRVSTDLKKDNQTALDSKGNTETNKSCIINKLEISKTILRPSKAPPPIPAKPIKPILDNYISNKKDSIEIVNNAAILKKKEIFNTIIQSSQTRLSESTKFINTTRDMMYQKSTKEVNNPTNEIIQSKGWVKTVIGRFE